jgi:phage-related protein
MAHDTFPAFAACQGSSPQEIANVQRLSFGDGYTQRVPQGLNHISRVWNVIFDLKTPAEKNTIVNFLRSQGGVKSFWWTPPGESAPALWTCKEWAPVPNLVTYDISAVFVEEFDLA